MPEPWWNKTGLENWSNQCAIMSYWGITAEQYAAIHATIERRLEADGILDLVRNGFQLGKMSYNPIRRAAHRSTHVVPEIGERILNGARVRTLGPAISMALQCINDHARQAPPACSEGDLGDESMSGEEEPPRTRRRRIGSGARVNCLHASSPGDGHDQCVPLGQSHASRRLVSPCDTENATKGARPAPQVAQTNRIDRRVLGEIQPRSSGSSVS
ncbi:hypothetical protein NA57DRAFT_56210 [Rhizodiscina lignyota]|uniref:Uncharacterized protein n=1 Tax=Rhizodiscina lignyota TaxID=1504668 RepID=A0A9P4IFW6_9PEZI|nr:hypothetical protein NA57DRAFT_56210 [Rhizodiscina lignyota]